jgi:peptide-methionine (S)-S-oxide reductase
MVTPENALPGRSDYGFTVPTTHAVNGRAIVPPFPDGLETAVFGLGCFWGAEKTFWNTAGVFSTAVGYAGGYTPFPTYDEVCSGLTGHAEVVLVVFDPAVVSYAQLLSVYFTSENQQNQATAAKAAYTRRLAEHRKPPATSEIAPVGEFYYAEAYHQQYLEKNPFGYCPDHGTGISCPVGLFAATS